MQSDLKIKKRKKADMLMFGLLAHLEQKNLKFFSPLLPTTAVYWEIGKLDN